MEAYKEKYIQLEKEYATKLALMTPLKQDDIIHALYKRKFEQLYKDALLQVKTHDDILQDIDEKLNELYVHQSYHTHAEHVKNRLHDVHTDRLHKTCTSIMCSNLSAAQKKKLCLAATIRTFMYHLSLEDRYNQLKLELNVM